ncbi:MAG: hypothetical protein M1831_005917 [Alyxoria varia]|nr:MAG: hypothetical protein M1831_005917 [Alyxoria varia]
MTEQNKNLFLFQQPETLTYDENSRDWRCLGLQVSSEAARGEARLGYALHRKKPTAKREQTCRRLIHSFPELGAAAGFLEELSAEDAGPAAGEYTRDETLIEELSGSSDDSSVDGSQDGKFNGRESGPTITLRHLFERDDDVDLEWSVPQNFVYDEIAQPAETVQDLHQATADLRSGLEQRQPVLFKAASQTLDGLIGGVPLSRNIRDSNDVLQDLLGGPSSSSNLIGDWLHLQRLSLPNGLGLDSALPTDSSLQSIHQILENHWIHSLADKIPSSVRLSKARVARHVALATFLASIAAQRRDLNQLEDKVGEPKQSSLAPEAFPSRESPYTSPPLASKPIDAGDHTDDGPMPIQVHYPAAVLAPSKAVERILSHLDSPRDMSLSTLAGRREAIAGSAMNPEQRAKQRQIVARRAQLDSQRERKRQKLESKGRDPFRAGRVLESASQPVTAGLAPSAWESSQPAYATQSQSQQTQASQGVRSDFDGKLSSEGQQRQDPWVDDIAASQVLPGAFGGRQGLTLRRKDKGKRKAGF